MSDSDLYDIAARAGLERGFRSAHGEHVDTPPHAIAAVLRSLGYDVSSDTKPLWLVCRWCMAVVSSCREMLG